MSQEKLEKAKKQTQNQNHLTQDEKDLLCNDYIHELRDSKKVESGHTFDKHLQKLRIIRRNHPELDLTDLQPSTELHKKIRHEIQESTYKETQTEKYSEYSKRNKEDFWTAWKYFNTLMHGEDPDNFPPAEFKSREEDVDKQADTRPEDLPTPNQVRKLLKELEQNSNDTRLGKRNVAYYLLLWDLGTRKNEVRTLQMKQVDVRKDKIRFFIEGNKSSDDDWIRLLQGEQFLREYIESHPQKSDPDAYLFPKTYYSNYTEPITGRQLKNKMLQAKAGAGVDFKTYGEPNHIYRKAMTTFYVVNNILDYDKVCTRQRKSGDGTKPDYLLMAMEDVDAEAAENLGLDEETGEEGKGHRMKQPALLPKTCTDCGRTNNCLREQCESCNAELPESSMPQNMDKEEAEEQLTRYERLAKQFEKNPEKVLKTLEDNLE